MSIVASKAGIHCVGSSRNGYSPFLATINAAGRRLSLVKVRDDYGAASEPLSLWPETVCIATRTNWDGGPFDAQDAMNKIGAEYAKNPHIHYWEYLNEINGLYKEQADFYIALMPLMKLAGLGLVIFNSASGTPQYPDIDPAPYAEVVRACKFAKDNGYDVLLGLHEYVSDFGPDTIGRYKVLADYLAAHNALIPIAITEWLFETYPGDDIFMAAVEAYDPIYMPDSRVIGTATWTLGGGGWSGSNFATALPRLGQYIATVAQEEQPPMTKGGLHLSALGNHSDDPSLPLEIQAMQVAHINRAKFMSNGDPTFVHALVAAGVDMAGSVCRLYAAGDNPVLGDPTNFYLQQRAYITEVYGHGVRMFEVHNEPNLASEGYGKFWTTPAEFAANFYAPVARLIIDNFPGVQMLYPGLSPQPDWALWKPSITSLINQGLVQFIAVHCYWDSAANMRSANQGRTYERFADLGRDLIITEASHNINNVSNPGAEYGEYIATLPAYVNGVFFFVSYGPAYDGSGETWVRGNPPMLTAIPGAVAAYVPPVQPPQPSDSYEFDYFDLDGVRHDEVPLVIAMDAPHVLTPHAKKVIVTFPLTVNPCPEYAGLTVALNPPGGVYQAGLSVEATPQL